MLINEKVFHKLHTDPNDFTLSFRFVAVANVLRFMQRNRNKIWIFTQMNYLQ